jgi:RimJ/RimL family protein N-acetyltransferase
MFTSDALTTARLALRRYEQSDLDSCVALFTDPDCMTYVGDGVVSPEVATRVFSTCFKIYEEGRFAIWGVFDIQTGAYIGHAELKPRKEPDEVEIVYILKKERWGQGYATEIARLIVDHGFTRYGLPRVFATVDYENLPSHHVLEKVGMRFVREERDEVGPYAVYVVERPVTDSQ